MLSAVSSAVVSAWEFLIGQFTIEWGSIAGVVMVQWPKLLEVRLRGETSSRTLSPDRSWHNDGDGTVQRTAV